jgi:hypothetical protein
MTHENLKDAALEAAHSAKDAGREALDAAKSSVAETAQAARAAIRDEAETRWPKVFAPLLATKAVTVCMGGCWRRSRPASLICPKA